MKHATFWSVVAFWLEVAGYALLLYSDWRICAGIVLLRFSDISEQATQRQK